MANLAKGKTRITVTLPERVVERLDQVAEAKGLTKSVLLTIMTDRLYPLDDDTAPIEKKQND